MFNYILYKIGEFIALRLPLKITYKIAVFISDLRYLFAAEDRKAVTANLKAIFPEKSDRQIRDIRLRMFRNFAKYLADFLRFSKIDKGFIENKVRIENLHYFDQAISRGKGVIVLTAHLGNWELGGVVIALSGYPFWVVALPHRDNRVDDFFNNQRESKGMHVIPLGRAARQCISILKQNKMLALLGDRDFTEKGIIVDFFNKSTYLPWGPAIFSMKMGSSIVPGFMIRQPDDTFTLRIEKPIEFTEEIKEGNNLDKDTEKNKNLLKAINSYKVILEDYIRKYPDQWYMFRRFWIP